MLKILILSDSKSIHTIKWAKSLSEEGFSVSVFSLNNSQESMYRKSGISLYEYPIYEDAYRYSSFVKIRYLKALPYLVKLVKKIKPDVIHAHFASSYGLLGSLLRFHPYVISVWGYDIFEFPKKSLIHKMILKYNLFCADKILSTSNIMKKEAQQYTNKDIEVTPFGIDTKKFSPKKIKSLYSADDIVIGTVKTLEKKYGIKYLIQAFKILVDKYPGLQLKLLIVGGGSQESRLKDLVDDLNISNLVTFIGRTNHEFVPFYLNMLSVYVSVSNTESFGVAVVEASSCEKPVVVSNVGGLPEVVKNNITGLIVPPRDPVSTASAIEKMILNPELRLKIAKSGRKHVVNLYDWKNCIKQMSKIYKEVVIQNDK